MGLIGRALAKFHLAEQGYFVSFDLLCPSKDSEAQPYRFDIAGLKIEEGKIVQAAVGILRAWWFPSAHLTPSMIRRHLKPAIPGALSDEAIKAFRRRLDLGFVPVDRLLFFSHASPEKSEEAERLLKTWNIDTVYLERVAAQLRSMPISGNQLADPFITQVMSMLRGATRDLRQKNAVEQEPEVKIPVPAPRMEEPQLELGFFTPISTADTPMTTQNDDEQEN